MNQRGYSKAILLQQMQMYKALYGDRLNHNEACYIFKPKNTGAPLKLYYRGGIPSANMNKRNTFMCTNNRWYVCRAAQGEGPKANIWKPLLINQVPKRMQAWVLLLGD